MCTFHHNNRKLWCTCGQSAKTASDTPRANAEHEQRFPRERVEDFASTGEPRRPSPGRKTPAIHHEPTPITTSASPPATGSKTRTFPSLSHKRAAAHPSPGPQGHHCFHRADADHKQHIASSSSTRDIIRPVATRSAPSRIHKGAWARTWQSAPRVRPSPRPRRVPDSDGCRRAARSRPSPGADGVKAIPLCPSSITALPPGSATRTFPRPTQDARPSPGPRMRPARTPRIQRRAAARRRQKSRQDAHLPIA